MSTTTTRQFQDTRVDARLVLTALWTAMLFVFAYVDILGFYRGDVAHAALRGRLAGTGVAVDQQFLLLSLGYVLPAALMVVLCLAVTPRVNRILNLAVSTLYVVSIAVACIGESHLYYLLGSAVEVVLLVAVARAAWTWGSCRGPWSWHRGGQPMAMSTKRE